MTDSEQAGFLLFLAAMAGPFYVAWRLAGAEARRNPVSMDLFFAGAAGAVLGFLALFIPAFLYDLGNSYGLLPDLFYDPRSNHPGRDTFFLFAVAVIACTWFGFLSGLALVMRKMGRRRAGGLVLLTPLVLYILITGLYAVLARLGATWAPDFAGPSLFAFAPVLSAVAGLWLLVRHRREEADGDGVPGRGPHPRRGTTD